jgi:hypothetical protein
VIIAFFFEHGVCRYRKGRVQNRCSAGTGRRPTRTVTCSRHGTALGPPPIPSTVVSIRFPFGSTVRRRFLARSLACRLALVLAIHGGAACMHARGERLELWNPCALPAQRGVNSQRSSPACCSTLRPRPQIRSAGVVPCHHACRAACGARMALFGSYVASHHQRFEGAKRTTDYCTD